MNTATTVLLCCLALVGIAGAAEAHITYYNPVTEECGELPGPHVDLSGGQCHDEPDSGNGG